MNEETENDLKVSFLSEKLRFLLKKYLDDQKYSNPLRAQVGINLIIMALLEL